MKRNRKNIMTNSNAYALAKQARLSAVVMVVTIGLWLAMQWLGGQMGWDTRFVFLFDMAAIAAFVWTLNISWRLWRRRNADHSSN